MSNANQLQTQAIQYIGNVRESHQQLIRRYVKDYRTILDEVEISIKDLENVKARLNDYKDETRLNNFFAPIQHRYASRSSELTTGFANDIGDSCTNVERQINSIIPNANTTNKPLFAVMNFDNADEIESDTKFDGITNMLRNASTALRDLARKSKTTFTIAYIIMGICSLIGFVIGARFVIDNSFLVNRFYSVSMGTVIFWGIFHAAIWFGISYLILKKTYILKSIKKYADNFIQSFTSQKENMVTDFGSVLKQYVNETEKNRFSKLQETIQNAYVPELSE